MKRRDFLKVGSTVGASSLLLDSCGKPEENLIPLLIPEEELIPGVDAWVNTLCQQCSAGCGISARVMPGESMRQVDGLTKRIRTPQAKKIEGNALHPLNQGKLCARGQAGLQVLYNPDRIQRPLQRKGKRGSGEFQLLNWDEALSVLTERLKALQAEGRPEGLVVLTGDPLRGSLKTLFERFAGAFATPYLIYDEVVSREALRESFQECTGSRSLPVADIENSHFLLSFGADLFETFLSPVRYNLAYGRMRRGRPGLRGKFVMASSRLSLTAANADEWLPIRPQAERLLALAMGHVMVKESLFDREFVARSCEGFSRYARMIEDYAPAAVASRAGIPEETIQRVAREFAQRQPSLAVADSADVPSLTAIHALNALAGTFGKPGGLLSDALPPTASFPFPRRGRSDVDAVFGFAGRFEQPAGRGLDTLLHHLLVQQQAPAEVLLLHEANPRYTYPGSGFLNEALEKVPFIASFASLMDETTAGADLILPSHTYLERWRDDVPEPGTGFAIRTLAQPVIKPRFDTRDPGDVLLEVARRLGGSVSEALPWKDVESLVQESFRPLHKVQKGSVVEDSFEAFWDEVKSKGGWWDAPASPSFTFQTPSKKFRFPGPPSIPPAQAGTAAENTFPLLLNLYASLALTDGRGANQPWLQELPDPMTTVMWGSWVELNPGTAAQLGIQQGDAVVVETAQGKLEMPAYLYPGLRPEVIAIPLGQGHQVFGRYASGRGANPLLLAAASPFGGASLSAIPARIFPAGRKMALTRFGGEGRVHSQLPLKR